MEPGGLKPWKWCLLPMMAAVIAMSYLWAGDLPNFASPKTARIIFWHVPMAILSMVWYFAAACYSGRYLARGNDFDDVRASRAAEMGLLLTVLATVTGAIFSKMQWAAGGLNAPWYYGYWQWDPKQTAIAIVILIFMAYFGLRMSLPEGRTRARVSAVYAILGAVLVPFLYFTLPHLPIFTTQHPTQVISRRDGMDTPYRTTFLLSTLCFLGISLWAYHLHLRVARVEEREALRRARVTESEEDRVVAVRREPALPETG